VKQRDREQLFLFSVFLANQPTTTVPPSPRRFYYYYITDTNIVAGSTKYDDHPTPRLPLRRRGNCVFIRSA